MRYTVTIKDNESGEILREVECKAIVGGLAINEEESVSIGISECNGVELLGACRSAKKAIHKVLENDPLGEVLFAIFELKLNAERREKLKKELEKDEKEDTDNA